MEDRDHIIDAQTRFAIVGVILAGLIILSVCMAVIKGV